MEKEDYEGSGAVNGSSREPMKRPDNGGKEAIKEVNFFVNHLRVDFNFSSITTQYNLDIKQVLPDDDEINTKLSSFELAMVRERLSALYPDEFPISMRVYDDRLNIFSPNRLPTGDFLVEFSDRTYDITMKEVKTVDVGLLENYMINGGVCCVPRNVLKALDVVMKEHPFKHMITISKSCYLKKISQDFGHAITPLHPTKQGLPTLCLNNSMLSLVPKPILVTDYLKNLLNLDCFDVLEFKQAIPFVKDVLTGLKVTINHRITKQKFTIMGLSDEDTKDIEFDLIDQNGKDPEEKVNLVEYFKTKYTKDIVHKDLPCLDLGKNGRTNFMPIEFCVLVEGQIYAKDKLNRKPSKELENLSPVDSDGPNSGEIIHNFGMTVQNEMISVTGRVLKAPMLKLGSENKEPNPVHNYWSLASNKVTMGSKVHRWAVIDFSFCNGISEIREDFVDQLVKRCGGLGVEIQGDYIHKQSDMNTLSDAAALEKLLGEVVDEANHIDQDETQPVLVLCALAYKDKGYRNLKWIAETKLGLVTQCFVTRTASTKDYNLVNLALKINAKFGGSNVELADGFDFFKEEDKVMLIGVDVNHPSPKDKTSPSIAAVVGSLNWPEASRYAARVLAQEHRKEEIQEFGETCWDLIKAYANQNNGDYPNKIVIFRDGLSDGQFDMVLNKELSNLKLSFYDGYDPKITLIVAQKRHQTRFFLDTDDCKDNVPSGTVVDTKVIHPFENDFYLYSHHGRIGTSKPTHYYVLWDENGFSSDEIQKLIFEMCFTFSRCTKPVSLVPPVYYADIVASRGRMYSEASRGERENQLRSGASLSMEDKADFKPHEVLENVMFFV